MSETAPGSTYQLVVFSGEDIRTFDLPAAGTVTIGRDERNTVCIDDPSVSRQHAVLRIGATLEIEDLGGPNGVFVREKASPGAGNGTLNIRRLFGRRSDLAIGNRILLGTASVVVRRATPVELPDLALATTGIAGAGVVVRDPSMQALYAQAARAARAQISVLLLGETGVGKEVLARSIHAYSPRSKGPFMGINCAGLPESLLESELYGNEKGAFTGAVQARAGLFEAANGGTVFLDEVGELPLATQAKLLRVLEERAVTRLGTSRLRPIDVRFLAATNRDLETDSAAGRFRQDLYFRLAGISLMIPPLRERPAEVDTLVKTFITAACRQLDRALPLTVSSQAFALLRAYPWPGNVRELRNVIDRAVVLCAGDVILPEHLPPSVLKSSPSPSSSRAPVAGLDPPSQPVSSDEATQESDRHLPGQIKTLERDRIAAALDRCAGNQSEAAKLLGISRGTLVARIQEFGLPRPRKRQAVSDK